MSSKLVLAVGVCLVASISTTSVAQEDDYYLKKVLPKISTLEATLESLDTKDEYRVRRFSTDVRLAKEMFAKAESSSPSYAKAKKRIEALVASASKLNEPKPKPKLAVSKELMQKKYGGQYGGAEIKMPKFLYGDLKADRKDEILAYMKNVKAIADDLKTELPAMKKNADEFKYQIRQAEYLNGDVEKQIKSLVERLMRTIQSANQRLKIAAEVDLSNKNHVRNRLSERVQKQISGLIENGEPLLNIALRIEDEFKTNYGSAKIQEEYLKLKDLYDAKIAMVAGGRLTDLPKALNKPDLLKIAKEVLKNERYGIKGWEKIIVNSDKKSKKRTTYEVSGDVLEKIVRDWDEFQVTTVEKMDGKLYLHFNTIAFYRSGASTTPTKKWILGNRFKGSEISPENAGIK